MVGAIGAHPEGSEHQFEMRTFAPGISVAEDPVCGSMHASVGQWLVRTGAVTGSYSVSQGARVNRTGTVHVTPDHETLWLGGGCATCIRGEVVL